jgi:hypothetical protein
LIRTFPIIEFAQLLAQPKYLYPDDGVGGLVKRLGPPKDVCCDGILFDGIDVALEISFADIFEQAGQARPVFEDARSQYGV